MKYTTAPRLQIARKGSDLSIEIGGPSRGVRQVARKSNRVIEKEVPLEPPMWSRRKLDRTLNYSTHPHGEPAVLSWSMLLWIVARSAKERAPPEQARLACDVL